MPTRSVLLAAAFLGCSCPRGPAVPEGLQCGQVLSATDTSTLVAALGQAVEGDCVLASTGTYTSALTVPRGVALAAEDGAAVTIKADSSGQAAVTLAPGARLQGLSIVSAPNIGVLIDRGPSTLERVRIDGAVEAGLVGWCEEDCVPVDPSYAHEIEITGSAVGLLLHGMRMKVEGGRIAQNLRGDRLVAGWGVVASHGAGLTLEGTVVEQNDFVGVLVDGAAGPTTAQLTNASIKDNEGRGVWIQDVQGSADAPKVRLESCVVEGNKMVGIGARNTAGMSIRGGRIAGTRLAKVSPNLGETDQVGDGLGLFENTSGISLDSVELRHNERLQVLIDRGGAGIRIQQSTVLTEGSQLGIVVQRTVESVQAPDLQVRPAGQELFFEAPVLQVPGLR